MQLLAANTSLSVCGAPLVSPQLRMLRHILSLAAPADQDSVDHPSSAFGEPSDPSKPFIPPPYYQSGNEPYVFVSYSHADSDEVYDDLRVLHEEGYRIFYDAGLPLGQQYTTELTTAIEASSMVVLFASKHSAASKHVRSEVDIAFNSDRTILPVCLESFRDGYPHSLRYYLAATNALMKLERSREEYLEALAQWLPAETKSGREISWLPTRREPPVQQKLREALEVSYLLLYSVDEGRSWQPIDLVSTTAIVPGDSAIKALLRPLSSCYAGLVIEWITREGRVGADTALLFASSDASSDEAAWRMVPALRWHMAPERGVLKEAEPDRTDCWRLGLVVTKLAPEASTPAASGLAAAPAGVGAGGPQPVRVRPDDIYSLARQSPKADVEGELSLGSLAHQKYSLLKPARATVLRGSASFVHWTEIRFQ